MTSSSALSRSTTMHTDCVCCELWRSSISILGKSLANWFPLLWGCEVSCPSSGHVRQVQVSCVKGQVLEHGVSIHTCWLACIWTQMHMSIERSPVCQCELLPFDASRSVKKPILLLNHCGHSHGAETQATEMLQKELWKNLPDKTTFFPDTKKHSYIFTWTQDHDLTFIHTI